MKSEMRIGRKEEEKRKEKGRVCGSEGEREQMQGGGVSVREQHREGVWQ